MISARMRALAAELARRSLEGLALAMLLGAFAGVLWLLDAAGILVPVVRLLGALDAIIVGVFLAMIALAVVAVIAAAVGLALFSSGRALWNTARSVGQRLARGRGRG